MTTTPTGGKLLSQSPNFRLRRATLLFIAKLPVWNCGSARQTLLALIAILGVAHFRPAQAEETTAVLRNVEVTDSQGKVRTGTLTELSTSQLTLGPADAIRLATRDVVLLRFPDRQMRLAADSPFVVLSDGEILALVPEMIDGESLSGRWQRDRELPAATVPLESIRGVIFDRPANATALARLLNLMLEGTESHDTIILRNGDLLEGEFSELNNSELALKTAVGTSSIRVDGVRALVMNPALASSETFRGEGALVSLIDGSRFRARNLKYVSPDRLTLDPRFGGNLTVPLAAVESIRFLGGCAAWLSDLKPAEYKFEPFLQLDWPLRRDRSVAGGFLKVRDVEYAKGLGVHSRSTVTYALNSEFRQFRATIGVDDVTSGKGNVVFEVLLDGKVAFKSDALKGTSAAVALKSLNLTGVKALSLRVDFAGEADILDHADWCDAVLIR